MEIAPFGNVQLPPGLHGKDILCACFHPTLPSAYVGLKASIVEYDVLGGSEVGVFPLRMPPQRLLYLRERNALVVCMVDGSVATLDSQDGHVLSEHSPSKPSESRPFVSCDIFSSGGVHVLLYSRIKSTAAYCINLFAQNKKPVSYSGHKSVVSGLVVHPSLPLVAVAAVDGTVRIFDITSAKLYNVIQYEKHKESVRVFSTLQFHCGGARMNVRGQKKKKKHEDALYNDIRLLLAADGYIVYYDVSIPGAPNKLRDYFEPGSVFRDARFYSLKNDWVFCFDNRGRFYALFADPALQREEHSAKQKGKKKGAKFTPNATAFSLLEECESIAVLQLKVRTGGRHAGLHRSSNDLAGSVSLSFAAHPSAPYFLFFGTDLAHGTSRTLPFYHLQGVQTSRGVTLPLHTTIPSPQSYWYQPDLAHSTVSGSVISLSLEGNNTMLVNLHDVSDNSATPLLAFLPRNAKGVMQHSTPISLCSAPDKIYVTVIQNGRVGVSGPPTPHWACIPLPKKAKGVPEIEFSEGRCWGVLEGEPLIGDSMGHTVRHGSTSSITLQRTERVVHSLCLNDNTALATIHDAAGRSSLRLMNGWAGYSALETECTHSTQHTALDLDAEEKVEEAVLSDIWVGIATSSRILFATIEQGELKVLYVVPLRVGAAPRAHSLSWVGRSLLYVTAGHVCSLTPDGAVLKLMAFPSRSSIAAVLRDRFVICTATADKNDVVWSRGANHFATVVRGLVLSGKSDSIRANLANVTQRYDCRNAPQSLLLFLCRRGLGDLASSLSNMNTRTQSTNIFIEAHAGSNTEIDSWESRCKLQITAGDHKGALACFEAAVSKMETACTRVSGHHGGGGEKLSNAGVFEAMAVALLQVLQDDELSLKVLSRLGNNASLIAHLRRIGDGTTLAKLGKMLSESDPISSKIATLAAAPLEHRNNPPYPPAIRQKWMLATTVLCPTTVSNPGNLQGKTLEALVSKDIRFYLRDASGVMEVEEVGGGVQEEEGSDDSDDDDDGRLQEIGVDGGDFGDDGGGDDEVQGDDEISKQQEELRRQYLASYAGDDADADPNDEDEGFGAQKKFKKFEIKKDAVFKQSLAGVALSFAPVPSAAVTRRKEGEEGEGEDGTATGGTAASPERAAVALPPSFLGTSAQEVCVFLFFSLHPVE